MFQIAASVFFEKIVVCFPCFAHNLIYTYKTIYKEYSYSVIVTEIIILLDVDKQNEKLEKYNRNEFKLCWNCN